MDKKLRTRGWAALHAARKDDEELEKTQKECKNDCDRRNLLIKFVLDATGGKLRGINSTKVESIQTRNKKEIWLTQAELGGPFPGLNSLEHAAIFIQSALPRPHKSNKAMRDAGIKQFQHFVEEKKDGTKKRKRQKLKTSRSLTKTSTIS